MRKKRHSDNASRVVSPVPTVSHGGQKMSPGSLQGLSLRYGFRDFVFVPESFCDPLQDAWILWDGQSNDIVTIDLPPRESVIHAGYFEYIDRDYRQASRCVEGARVSFVWTWHSGKGYQYGKENASIVLRLLQGANLLPRTTSLGVVSAQSLPLLPDGTPWTVAGYLAEQARNKQVVLLRNCPVTVTLPPPSLLIGKEEVRLVDSPNECLWTKDGDDERLYNFTVELKELWDSFDTGMPNRFQSKKARTIQKALVQKALQKKRNTQRGRRRR